MASWQEKALLFWALGLGAALAYFGSLHSALFPVAAMPVTMIDRAIPFEPWFVVPYLSFFLLIVLPLVVLKEREEVRLAAFGFGAIVAVSFVFFLIWPTAIPPVSAYATLSSVFALDLQRNACPSLHASLTVFSILILFRRVHRVRNRMLLAGWGAMILASALLTKRHVAIDIAAGATLGVAVYFALFRKEAERGVTVGESAPVVETLRIRRTLTETVPEQLATLTRHDILRRLRDLIVFPSICVGGMALICWGRSISSLPATVIGTLLTAVAINAMTLLMHEGMHGLLLPSRAWNWLVSVGLGSTFLMSFTAYRVLHERHHTYLGDARDPDDYHNYSHSRLTVWFLHFMRLTVGPILYLILIPILALRHGTARERKFICAEYTILLAVYSVLLRLFTLHDLFQTWMVPLLLVGVFTAIRGFTQHGITDASDPYIASRTMLPNPAVAFFLLNENYHLEHHLFPEVPSYHLPALHAAIWPKLPRTVSGRSYFAFLAAFLRATPTLDETPIGLSVHRDDAAEAARGR